MLRTFGMLDGGETVKEVTLAAGPLEAKVLTFGAILQDLRLHERPLMLSYTTLESRVAARGQHMGAIAGRCANRTNQGRFELDGTAYQVTQNLPDGNHLHGGTNGFGVRNWSIEEAASDTVLLRITAADGEEGYPGNVEAFCRYHLKPNGVLTITLTATTDKPTLVNLAPHGYFNLDGSADILDHRLKIVADSYLPVSSSLIPTGEIKAFEGTPFDFREMRPVRRVLPDGSRVVYDHNFCLADAPHEDLALAAVVEGPHSGVSMEIWTTEPGVQFYDGNGTGGFPGAGLDGRTYGANAGLCLEPQRWPDAANHPDFPGAVLRPGEEYCHVTEYRFHPAE